MATINHYWVVKHIIDRDGYGDPGELRTVRITRYYNYKGHECWGTVREGENIDKYQTETDYVQHPRIIWERTNGTTLPFIDDEILDAPPR